MLTAIIVAAGSSQRMGFDKLFALLGDKPVVAHTLDAFERTECVDEIILVGRDDRLAELQELVRQRGIEKSAARRCRRRSSAGFRPGRIGRARLRGALRGGA